MGKRDLMRKVQDTQDVDIDMLFDKKYPIITQELPNGGLHHTVYILTEIGAPSEFVELLTLMGSSEERDTILFKFNTPGGRLDPTIMFMDAAKSCKAMLIGEVVGDVASAGTMWLMSMDDIRVAKWGSMMIHNYSGGIGGKGGEIKSRLDFETPFLKAFMYDVYKTFLTKDEIATVVADHDIHMGYAEILKRWSLVQEKRSKKLQKKVAELEMQQQEAQLVEAWKVIEDIAKKE